MIGARGAAAVLSLAALAAAQEPAAEIDWNKEVERACTATRYGLRLAAARRVAQAGDEALPALRKFQAEKGRDAIPVALVEAIADEGDFGMHTADLLYQWASDRDFFWRGQALRGLARRRLAALRPMFTESLADPAWLCRAYAACGLFELDGVDVAGVRDVLERDPDPRARTKVAAWLLNRGRPEGLAELLAALCDRRTFLGYPWGQTRAADAFPALKTWAGEDHGYRPDLPWEQQAPAVQKFAALAGTRAGVLFRPVPLTDREVAIGGGIEVLSCKNGDLFLAWSPGGTVYSGIGLEQKVTLPEAAFGAWTGRHAAIANDSQQGVVICDRMRLKWDLPEPPLHFVAAPASLPVATARWLQDLAGLIEDAGDRALAGTLRDRLQQFAPAASGG